MDVKLLKNSELAKKTAKELHQYLNELSQKLQTHTHEVHTNKTKRTDLFKKIRRSRAQVLAHLTQLNLTKGKEQ